MLKRNAYNELNDDDNVFGLFISSKNDKTELLSSL